ncbi:MAG: hypothetical protein ACUZ8O_09435 [Candidatus Anammoxibacter sp.]
MGGTFKVIYKEGAKFDYYTLVSEFKKKSGFKNLLWVAVTFKGKVQEQNGEYCLRSSNTDEVYCLTEFTSKDYKDKINKNQPSAINALIEKTKGRDSDVLVTGRIISEKSIDDKRTNSETQLKIAVEKFEVLSVYIQDG